jgi:hypothetical protein
MSNIFIEREEDNYVAFQSKKVIAEGGTQMEAAKRTRRKKPDDPILAERVRNTEGGSPYKEPPASVDARSGPLSCDAVTAKLIKLPVSLNREGVRKTHRVLSQCRQSIKNKFHRAVAKNTPQLLLR